MILRAATRVFARNGYFNSKVADIARAAEVADGTVYLYFKSKEEILHSIFDQNMAEAIAAGGQLIENLDDPREKLRRIAKLHLERLGADRDLAVVFQVELRGSTKFMEEFSAAGFAEYLALLRRTFEEGQRAGVFRKYLLVVTDGENTSGRSPDQVTREIWQKSEGAVQVYFVAFDTSPEKFAFLKEAGGDVIGAGTGAELRKALDGIYQGKILAEAPAAGEREPVRH